MTSFRTALVIWVRHHWIFTLIRRSDHPFPYLKGVPLPSVTFVPFPRAPLSEYFLLPQEKVVYKPVHRNILRNFTRLRRAVAGCLEKAIGTRRGHPIEPARKTKRPRKLRSGIGLAPSSTWGLSGYRSYLCHGVSACVCFRHSLPGRGAATDLRQHDHELMTTMPANCVAKADGGFPASGPPDFLC